MLNSPISIGKRLARIDAALKEHGTVDNVALFLAGHDVWLDVGSVIDRKGEIDLVIDRSWYGEGGCDQRCEDDGEAHGYLVLEASQQTHQKGCD